MLSLLFMALLVSPQTTLGAQRASRVSMLVSSRAQKRQGAQSTPTWTDGSQLQHSTANALPRLVLRGGGDIHHSEVDIGHGNKVIVRAYKDGNAVVTSFTASCDGFDVQWGVALDQMDSWSHPKTAQGGKFAALVPQGSRDHMGTAVRTALGANAPVVINPNSLGTQDGQLWGLRFIIVEVI
jgi:hypothetical protein